MFYYTFKNKNGINKLKSIINAIDFKQKRVTLVNAKGERLFIKD